MAFRNTLILSFCLILQFLGASQKITSVASSSHSSCLSLGSITFTTSGGTAPYTYQIIGNSCNLPNPPKQNAPEFSKLSACIYIVSITDAQGSTLTDTVEVGGDYKVPQAVVNYNGCDLSIMMTSGRSPVQIRLSTDSLNFGPASANLKYSGLADGKYFIRITDTCSGVFNTSVTIQSAAISFDYKVLRNNGQLTDSFEITQMIGANNPSLFWIITGSDTVKSANARFAMRDIHKSCDSKLLIKHECGVSVSPFRFAFSQACLDQIEGKVSFENIIGQTPLSYSYLFNHPSLPPLVSFTASIDGLPKKDSLYVFAAVDACGDSSVSEYGNLRFTKPVIKIKKDSACLGQAQRISVEIGTDPSGYRPVYTYDCSTCVPRQKIKSDQAPIILSHLSGHEDSIHISDSCGSIWNFIINHQIHVKESCDTNRFSVSLLVYEILSNGKTLISEEAIPIQTYEVRQGQKIVDINSTGVFTKLALGKYIVIAQSDCILVIDSLEKQFSPLDINIQASKSIICPGESIILSIDTAKLNIASITWNTGATTAFIDVKSAGLYSALITNNFGCTDTAKINILLSDMALRYETKNNLCFKDAKGSIDLVINGGIEPYQYNWSNNSLSQNLVNLKAGKYKLTVTDAGNCTKQDSVIITEAPEFLLGFSSRAATCDIAHDGQIILMPSGGTPGYTYLWNNGLKTIRSDTLTPGSYSFTVTDKNACTQDLSVRVDGVSSISSVRFDTICFGSTLSLGKYIHSNSGQYLDTFKTNQGCDSLVYVNLTENPALNFTIASNGPACFGTNTGKIIVTNLSTFSPFVYFLNNRPSTSSSFPNLIAGNYVVKVQDKFGCFLEKGLALSNPSKSDLQLGNDTLIQYGDTIDLKAFSNILPADIKSIRWSSNAGPGCTNCLFQYKFAPLQDQIIKLSVENKAGCSFEDEIIIKVNLDFKVYAANLFAPDRAAEIQNQRFILSAGRQLKSIEYFRIFNRYGDLIFDTNNPPVNDISYGWDGTYKNQAAAPGVYIYLAQIQFADGTFRIVKGDVTLIR